MDIFDFIDASTNKEEKTIKKVKNTFKPIDEILASGINKNTIYRVESRRKRVRVSGSNTGQRLIFK